jgi:GNAT superfamily N-acetyltransferase
MEIAILSPGDEAQSVLDQRLLAFNRSQRPSVSWRTDDVFTIVLNDEAGKLRGGARAAVRLGALEIRTIWLDENLRRKGLGERIVRAAEDEGRRRGARAALLDTYEFQARGFYEKLGYVCFACFEFPDGVTRFYMSRSL